MKVLHAFNKTIIPNKQTKQLQNLESFFINYSMNTTKSLKIYNVGYTFKVQTVFKTNKHNNFEDFDQIILMQTKKKIKIN